MSSEEAAVGIAREVVQMAKEGRFDDIVGRLSSSIRALATPEMLRGAWEAELGRHGALVEIGGPQAEPARAGVVVVKVPVTCEHGGLTVVVPVTGTGELAGLVLAPAEAAQAVAGWDPPPYADPAAFTERDLPLGSGPLAVPGTLSVPLASGPGPAVVLLGGSGPTDRDGTVGPNKPLKDLAWGLASRGVAVVRFDKVTLAHPEECRAMGRFTLEDEYVPAGRAALEALRHEPRVDPARIFVAGHSLGGTAAPRLAAADGAVAGLVLLAAGAAPLQRSMLRQVRYLASLDPATAARAEPGIAVLERQAELVESDRLSSATPPSELPLGVPGSYWLDLGSHDPVAAAAALGCPILVVQGGRDYQATVEDDLALWQAGLAGRADVTVRLFPADDHLLVPGSGPSSPSQYAAARHVDPAVVTEVAAWLTSHAASKPGRAQP